MNTSLLSVRMFNASRDVQMAFTIVDELCESSPDLRKDKFFDVMDVDIPYNAQTEIYRNRRFEGSAISVYVRFIKVRLSILYVAANPFFLVVRALRVHTYTGEHLKMAVAFMLNRKNLLKFENS